MMKKVMLLTMVVANCYAMEEKLLDTLRKDDVDQMRKLIVEDKADQNSYKSETNKMTLLHFAVLCEKEKFVDLLATNGAKLSAEDTKGWAPIHLAAARNSAKMVDALLKHNPKSQMSLRDKDGQTPLLLALRMGNQAAAQALYSHGGTDAVAEL